MTDKQITRQAKEARIKQAVRSQWVGDPDEKIPMSYFNEMIDELDDEDVDALYQSALSGGKVL